MFPCWVRPVRYLTIYLIISDLYLQLLVLSFNIVVFYQIGTGTCGFHHYD